MMEGMKEKSKASQKRGVSAVVHKQRSIGLWEGGNSSMTQHGGETDLGRGWDRRVHASPYETLSAHPLPFCFSLHYKHMQVYI